MAGTFSKANRPRRPGAYFNFQAAEAEPQLGSTTGTVLVPFTHSWGPSETITELNSFGDFLAIFGRGSEVGEYTEGYQAVHDAFRGEGFGGRAGAGTVLAYRLVGAAGAKASKVVQNTTPANAITLTARYDGSKGNDLKVQVVANAVDSVTYNDLVIYDGSIEIERWRHAKTDITQLAADINAGSNWVTAGSVTSGTALGIQGSPVDFTGGDDGTTLLAADYTALMSAAEPHRFSLFAAANLTDSGILASVATWSAGLNVSGKRFLSVVGGAAGETVSTAVTRSATFNDPNVVNLGGGTYTDSKFGDVSTAQLAPRVAGILAAAGEAESITFKRLAGLSIKLGSTNAEVLSALDGGVVTIARDSHPEAPVRLEKGLTTFTDTDDDDRPLEIYSNPKFVRTMHALELELTEFGEVNVIGRLPVNDSTREYLVGQMSARLEAREIAGVIQAGWTVDVDNDPPPSDSDEFIGLVYSIGFGRSLEQVFNTVVVG
jgi:hypothetical protein